MVRPAATLTGAYSCLIARWRSDAIAIIVRHRQFIRATVKDIMTAPRDDRLKGKVAIVTGAGSRAEGIGNGRATSVILARHGARVTLVDTTAQWAEETKRLIDA